VASLSQGRTAAAQCGLFTRKSVPVIFEPPCIIMKTLDRPKRIIAYHNSMDYDFNKKPNIVSLTL